MGRASRIDFCCFAFPLINLGAYTICLEFAVIALCVAVLAIAPPSIVATMSTLPGAFSKIVVCILGVVTLAWQPVGLVAIRRESARVYRLYTRVNFTLTLATLLATLAFFIVAAARHNTAKAACALAYGTVPEGSRSIGTSDLVSVGDKICDIFLYVQIGFMGLMIALVGLTQLYMCALQRSYGKELRHASRGLKSTSGDDIPLATRGSGIWDPPTADHRSYDDGYDTPKRQSASHSMPTSAGGYPSYERDART